MTISAALGRDCFVDYGYYTIYPNLYVVLVGPSAVAKKSTPIKIATRFLKAVTPPINILSQKMTPEALIESLSGLSGDVGDTKVVPSAVGIAIVSEMDTLINQGSFKSGMIGILTDLYDAEDFEYRTRSRGRELVKNPCLSIIGGSTMQWIREAIPVVSIGGGFTSRIVFVYSRGSGKLIPRPHMSDKDKHRKEHIIQDLQAIARMRGPFALDAEAIDIYDKEYVRFRKKSPLLDDENLGGYVGRRHDILTKVAMATSASRSDSRLITKRDITLAMGIVSKAEEDMPNILKAITAEKVGDVFEQIIKFIERRKIVTRPELMRAFRHKMTSVEMDALIKTLDEAEIIAVEWDGSAPRYVFKGKKQR
jgi:hypothetical protein